MGSQKGLTLIELVVSMTVLAILASAILPLAHLSAKRTKEIELRRNLRLIREAIDEYKRYVDEGLIEKGLGESGYPKTLEILVEGVELKGGGKKKFLRRISKDPMTKDGEWGFRSYIDEPDSTSWGGEDVYDVYSLSEDTAIDGSRYSSW